MESGWKTHNGKRFFYADYSDLDMDHEKLALENDRVDAMIRAEREGSVLAITNVENTVATREIMDILKKSAFRTKPYIIRHAVLGVSGIRKILADSIIRFSGQPIRLFDDMESAKEWLVED